MTAREFHAYLHRLAMEAYDGRDPLAPRASFSRLVSERLAQAAQVVALEGLVETPPTVITCRPVTP